MRNQLAEAVDCLLELIAAGADKAEALEHVLRTHNINLKKLEN